MQKSLSHIPYKFDSSTFNCLKIIIKKFKKKSGFAYVLEGSVYNNKH